MEEGIKVQLPRERKPFKKLKDWIIKMNVYKKIHIINQNNRVIL